MIVTMSCIHLLYMYLIGARKQDLVYVAVLDAILLLITVLVGFFRYSRSSAIKKIHMSAVRPNGVYNFLVRPIFFSELSKQ